jgi:hypothetical protein
MDYSRLSRGDGGRGGEKGEDVELHLENWEVDMWF